MSALQSKPYQARHSPEDTKDTVIEVDQADVRRRDPDVENVDDELVSDSLPSHLQVLELQVALGLQALLRPCLALQLLDLVREATSLQAHCQGKIPLSKENVGVPSRDHARC